MPLFNRNELTKCKFILDTIDSAVSRMVAGSLIERAPIDALEYLIAHIQLHPEREQKLLQELRLIAAVPGRGFRALKLQQFIERLRGTCKGKLLRTAQLMQDLGEAKKEQRDAKATAPPDRPRIKQANSRVFFAFRAIKSASSDAFAESSYATQSDPDDVLEGEELRAWQELCQRRRAEKAAKAATVGG